MNAPEIPFVEFPKIPRYAREVVVTEKIDGTNAQIYIDDLGEKVYAGSRNRWLTTLTKQSDNYGFAAWVEANAEELRKLGPGHHYGEWWGAGVARRYNVPLKRFSLFNVAKWSDPLARPACCEVVPVLWRGNFEEMPLAQILDDLRANGSVAAPGFMQPEGVVIFHTAGGVLFKKLLMGDELPKGLVTYAEKRAPRPLGAP